MSRSKRDDEKKSKNKKSVLEAEIMAMIQATARAAVQQAVDELLKGFK